MFFFNYEYLLFMLPAFVLTLAAQWWVSSTYRKWSQVRNARSMSGAQAAHELLRYGGMSDVKLEPTPGELSDHYDPRGRILRLSPGVARGESVAALAIAAHEIGHAEQHQQGYAPLRLRSALVPAVNIGSQLGWILIVAGIFLQGFLGTQLASTVAWIGVGAFALGAVFALATLPVELNASARARELLQRSGLVHAGSEVRGVSAVLNAAAFTYIAGLATALLQVLYWATVVAGMGRRR